MRKEPHKVAHRVSEGESSDGVMTIAWLKALLDTGTYPDNMIVMLTEDYVTSKQITGFFTAGDCETKEPILVLTTRPDAQKERFARASEECPTSEHAE